MNVHRYIADKIRSGIPNRRNGSGMSSVSATIGLVSVAVSIFVIIVAISVVMGFRSEIRTKASGFMGELSLTAPGQSPMNEQYPFTDSISFLPAIRELGAVDHTQRVAYRSGLIKTDDNIYGAYFKGVDSLYNFSFFERNLSGGEMPSFTGRISSDVMVARRLAVQMGCEVGDQLTAYFIGDDVRLRKFRIAGTFDAQIEDLDNAMVVCDIRQVQRLNDWEKDEVSTVEIILRPGADIDRACSQVDDIIYEQSDEDDPSLFVTSVKQLFPNLFDWLKLLDFNVVAILLLMIVVAGFNMISSLLIILFENISSIGLLKSIGMTTAGVSKVFRYVALNIVAKGLAIGNVAALALCAVQKHTHLLKLDPANYFVDHVPISFSVRYIVAADVASLLIIMLILMLTSRFIAKVSPDKTMRVA